jgi:hypothetical protein
METRTEVYNYFASKVMWVGSDPIWKDRPAANSRARIGDKAGIINSSGYRHINLRYEGKRVYIYAHRLRWFMETGDIPIMLDHIDRDKTNNNYSNLRLATRSLNNRNRKLPKLSGLPTGVLASNSRFRARICVDNRNIELGSFDTIGEASAAYKLAYDKEIANG